MKSARRLLLAALLAAPALAQNVTSPDVVVPRLFADADRLVAGGAFRLALVAEIRPGWHVNSHTPKEDFLIPTVVTLAPVAGLGAGTVTYPKQLEKKFAFSEAPLAVYEGRTLFRVGGNVAADAAPGPRTLIATIEYQPCNDQQCLAPTKLVAKLTIEVAKAGTVASPANPDVFPPAAKPSSKVAGASKDPFTGKSLPLLLGFVFVIGLALNLTPCVYPMIPITVSYFLKQSEGRRSRAVALAFMYLAGMCVTYTTLGVFAAITGALFGAWLQKTVVIVAIAAVIAAMSLSMFGLFEIRAPHFITDRSGARSGAAGAFTMGLFLGFVAAPCVGPFIVSLLTFVGNVGSVPFGALLFFFVGLGLGFPYLVLGAVSASLPRSGDWMNVIKKFFGFALLSLAVYFLRPVLPERTYDIAFALPLLAGGLYFLFFEKSGRALGWFRALKTTLAVGLVAAGIVFALPERSAKALAFEPFSEKLLSEARAAGRPVMIDFFADWCLPCKELDKKTFTDRRVIEAGAGWVFLKANLTKEGSPEVSALRETWNVKGVPTILFLGPDGSETGSRVVGFEEPEKFAERLRVD